MKFKIYIDPELDNDPTDTRYHHTGDDLSKLPGLPSQQLQLPGKDNNKLSMQPVEIQEFKPLFNPNQTYMHLR